MTGPEKLKQLASDIAGLLEQEALLKAPVRSISPDLGEWFIRAVRSSDPIKALGLTNRRGRPSKQNPHTLALARRAFFIKQEQPKKTFQQIAEEIRAPDGEWLRKEYNNHKDQILIELRSAKLTAGLKERDERRRQRRRLK